MPIVIERPQCNVCGTLALSPDAAIPRRWLQLNVGDHASLVLDIRAYERAATPSARGVKLNLNAQPDKAVYSRIA